MRAQLMRYRGYSAETEPLHSPPVVAFDDAALGNGQGGSNPQCYTPPDIKHREDSTAVGKGNSTPYSRGRSGRESPGHLAAGDAGSANEGIELKKAASNPLLGQFHLGDNARRMVQPYIGRGSQPPGRP